jgi:hypothetical protein
MLELIVAQDVVRKRLEDAFGFEPETRRPDPTRRPFSAIAFALVRRPLRRLRSGGDAVGSPCPQVTGR